MASPSSMQETSTQQIEHSAIDPEMQHEHSMSLRRQRTDPEMQQEHSMGSGMRHQRSQRRDAATRGNSFCTEAADGSPLTRTYSELRARRGREVDDPMPTSGSLALRASTLAAKHPCKALCGGWGGVLLLTLAGVLSGELGFSEEGEKDWMVLNDAHSEALDAIELAEAAVDCIPQNGSCPELPIRIQANKGILGLTLVYESSADGIMFTPERLRQACVVERVFLENEYYPQFCNLKRGALAAAAAADGRPLNSSDCRAQSTSVVQFFYNDSSPSCNLLSADSVAAKEWLLLDMLQDPETKRQAGLYIGADSSGERDLGRTRSVLGLGYPLEDYEDVAPTSMTLKTATKMFWQRLEDDMMELFGKHHSFTRTAYWEPWTLGDAEPVEILFRSLNLQDLESERVVNSDMGWLLLSMLFVWLCLVWRTTSVFVGSLSLLQILFSIPVAFSVYRFVFQITYFQQLHGILIFIMLGIGADAVFVFSDAWQQSEELLSGSDRLGSDDSDETTGDLIARLALAYQRTMVSVFNTSFTTAVAFLATAVSPIMPIRTMGIFACLLVLTNYIFVITLTPAAFAVWQAYSVSCARCCCCPRWRTRKQPEAAVEEDAQRPESEQSSAQQQARASQASSKSSLLERCFLPVFGTPSVAVASALLFAAWGGLNCYWAAQLEPPPEMFQFFGKEHMHTRVMDLSRAGFLAGGDNDYIVLQISFGVAGVDRAPNSSVSVDPWAPHKFYGVQVWDEHFDLGQPAAQDFLRSFCDQLRKVTCASTGCSDGLLVRNETSAVSCFIEEFDRWADDARYEGTDFATQLLEFRNTEKPKQVLNNQNTWEKSIGFVNGRLRYVEIQAMLTLRTMQPGSIREEVKETILKFLSDVRGQDSAQVAGHVLPSVGADWIMLVLEQELVRGLFNGFAICFPTAFVVLLLATQNVLVALYAITTIGAIVMSVLGWCWAIEGWYLGVSESIAGIIVIGLAVDYVIHLGHMYLEVGHLGYETRAERWRMALKNMGVTVLAGAFTTLAAGLSMRFCQMTFFLQMSTLISVTIVYSLLFTLFFFMCLLRVAGPERNCGDISRFLRRAGSALKCRTRDASQSCEDIPPSVARHLTMA